MNIAKLPARMAVAQIGARRHYSVPRALHEAGILEQLITDSYGAGITPFLSRWSMLRRWSGRRAENLPPDKVRQFPIFGLRRALRNRLSQTPARRLAAYVDWNRTFGRLVRENWPASADSVYVFNAAGLEILQEAQRRSLNGFLDQTAAPWAVEEPLLSEERARWPGWEFEGTTPRDWEPLAERERQEWQLADRIICGSDYVRDSISAVRGPAGKCVVVPYAVIPAGDARRREKNRKDPFRVLFVGTIQLRKGIQYLARAAALLKGQDYEFRAIGPIRISSDAAKQVAETITLAGPLARGLMGDEYGRADVLVLPSLSEGSANVCYEALAAGVPVITTPNAGSVIRDGQEGFIVPIRSVEVLAEKIRRLQSNPDLWLTMCANARKRADEFSWPNYVQRLVEAVRL